MLRFEVVDAQIPAILGMPFFNQVNPQINWRRRVFSVQRGSRRTNVQLVVFKAKRGGNKLNVVQEEKLSFSNQFDVLEVEETQTQQADDQRQLQLRQCDLNESQSSSYMSYRPKITTKQRGKNSGVVCVNQNCCGLNTCTLEVHASGGSRSARAAGVFVPSPRTGKEVLRSMHENPRRGRGNSGSTAIKSDTINSVEADQREKKCANKDKQSCQYGEDINLNQVNFTKFRQLLQDLVSRKLSYLCDLECELVGGLDKCLIAFGDAVEKNLLIQNLYCHKCQFPHLDVDEQVKLHRTHLCLQCDHLFPIDDRVVGNPLAKVIKFSDVVDLLNKSIDYSSVAELCNLRSFIKGVRKQQYESQFLVLINKVSHGVQNDSESKFKLNFTHQSAYGELGEGDKHGQLQQLANETMQTLQNAFPEVFKEPSYPVDRGDLNPLFEHKIQLKDPNAPIPRKKLYPLDDLELKELRTQIESLMADGRIVVSDSPYGAPILFARKKNGKLRMCIDYRQLNSNTVLDSYPLPRIDQLTNQLDGAKIFSKIDLNNAYHQLPMAIDDRQKTAFTTRYGTFEFLVMPFGLCNAPSSFQRVMHRVFFDLLDRGVVVYMDDILVYSKTIQEHQFLLKRVFDLLSKYKLFVKAEKCALFLESVEFLGHTINGEGLNVEQGKIKAVVDWPVPKNLTEVQSFLGLCNYYRKFIPRFSELAAPLTSLTRKNVDFVFGSDQLKSFDLLKKALSSTPCLKLFDRSCDTRIVCDASDFCIGGILEQYTDGFWKPVEFFSKRLNSAERNYSATEREFCAIKMCLERWRHFLIGIHFVVLSDHAALTYLTKQSHLSRRQARWLDFFQEFSFDIQHIPGSKNVADYLSRIPGTQSLNVGQLCSVNFTCDIRHSDEFANNESVTSGQQVHFNNIISIFEESSFLERVREIQQRCQNPWFVNKYSQAQQDVRGVFQLRNGILCKLVEDKFCPVIPDDESQLKQVILSDLHCSSLGGHVGVRKLLKLVSQRFYWLNMRADVEKFCKLCLKCQQNKVMTQKQYGLLQPLENPSRCFEHVTMDFISLLPVTHNDADAIFTIVDQFSRLVRFIPCKSSSSASDIAQLFFDQWICNYGVPQKIISDRDTRFTSMFWQSLMRCLQCKLALSTAYHPQTDGLSERFHRSIEEILRSYVGVNQDDWDLCLSSCQFALNNSVHSGTKVAPFEVVYGCTLSLPLDLAVQSLQDNKVQLVDDVLRRRQAVQALVSQNLLKSQSAMTQQANKHRRDITFAVGDLVWLKTNNLNLPAQLTKKLSTRWIGPFPITQVVSRNSYRLQLPPSWRLHPVFNVSQLKPHHGGRPVVEPPVFDTEDGPEWEVDSILRHRSRRGRQPEYLIRWKGFGQSEDSWEPEENLAGAQRLLKAYKQRNGL